MLSFAAKEENKLMALLVRLIALRYSTSASIFLIKETAENINDTSNCKACAAPLKVSLNFERRKLLYEVEFRCGLYDS